MEFLVLFAAILFVLSAQAFHAIGQPGFISIDCGLDDGNNSSYTDSETGIFYVSDGGYVDGGENHAVASEYHQGTSERYLTLRSFPSGMRNCYTLPTVAGAKYLARMEFYYGNYDGKDSSSSSSSSPPVEFDLYLGADYWDTAELAGGNFVSEAVFMAWAGWTPLCLVNTGLGTPFVSTVELRPLPDASYPPVNPRLAMAMYRRFNMGPSTSHTRFPDDAHDRFWFPMDMADRLVNLSTPMTVKPDPDFDEPQPVLRTAVTSAQNNTVLTENWRDRRRTSYSFLVFMHFADFQSAQLREFDIYVNNKKRPNPFTPSSLVAWCIYTTTWNTTPDATYNITLAATVRSVLPPMINAFEVYNTIPRSSLVTFSDDIDAIMAIKFEYGVKKNWMGDPCFPTINVWDGVQCRNASGKTMRIVSLNLSHSKLHGVLSTNFSKLTALENLDISYNNLSGSIPVSLSSMPSLRVLNVSGNHLSGDFLCTNHTGSLIFRYDSDTSGCGKRRSPSWKKTAVLVTSVAVPVLVVAALFLSYFIRRAKRQSNVSVDDRTEKFQPENGPSAEGQGNRLQDSEDRRFTYKELESFTGNFAQLIGQGGFGSVYYGRLEDGTVVAVKMRSESSSHGLDEFLAEVRSLTKVHHRNIVSLVGYCWEKNHLALVYEYMCQGNLYDHLRGKNAAVEILNWRMRVRIMLEAAQGLDYLHNGCTPPIIHRDVKSSNILLDRNLQAKIADLGLSRSYLNDAQTHISATAAGTPGYMDPEYYLSGRITESSDVFSFGVVLLEAATGEPPMVPGHGHIVQRVKQRIAAGDIGSIADSRLGGAYDVSSMWVVVDTAMACMADAGANRPTMTDVVAQLKESLALEHARENDSSVTAPSLQSDDALMSSFGPSAR